MYRIGRALFFAGGVLLIFVFLLDEVVLTSQDSIPTKVLAIIATTLLVFFADSGPKDREI